MGYLYWKLQTVPDESSDFGLFKEKYGKIYDEFGLVKEERGEEELKQLFNRIAYKNPLFSKIYSLSLAFVHNDTVKVKYFIGKEKDLIQTFLNTVNRSEWTLVQLDSGVLLPYFGIRASKNSIGVNHKGLKYKGLRPWNLESIGLKEYFQGAGDYRFSLKEIAYIYGLEADFIDYADEYVALQNQEYAELMESAKNELVLIVNCHRKSLGEDIVTEVELTHEKVDKVEEAGEFDPLKELVLNKQFTPQIKKAIQEKCKGKRLTKKDKENLATILRGAWVRVDFINNDQDSKTRIQDKELEIEKFIKTL